MSQKIHNILLFNPWIHDFAAFDFWNKPLGLLSIGAVLRQNGFEISLVDCLDRNHPLLAAYKDELKSRPDGTGKFFRQEIDKPKVLRHVPRRFCRYGLPKELVARLLAQIQPPDAIFITSFMTYWYTGVKEAVDLLRSVFPAAPIFLGGIYATLMSEHALQTIRPDHLIRGEGENQVLQYLGIHDRCYRHLDEYPFPAYDLYPSLESAAILTSRGCPFRCSFCASYCLTSDYRRRSVENVIAEIEHYYKKYRVSHMAFFDDALFHRAEIYFKPILKHIIKNGWQIQMHLPNGVHINRIDQEMAGLMYLAGVKTIRLSFESSDPARQATMSSKVTNQDLAAALENLQKAGYNRREIGVYVIYGLADQTIDEVMHSVDFVHSCGAKVNLASFSPIPQTIEWEKTISLGYDYIRRDPLLTNNSIYPIWAEKYGFAACLELEQYTKVGNNTLVEPANHYENIQ